MSLSDISNLCIVFLSYWGFVYFLEALYNVSGLCIVCRGFVRSVKVSPGPSAGGPSDLPSNIAMPQCKTIVIVNKSVWAEP